MSTLRSKRAVASRAPAKLLAASRKLRPTLTSSERKQAARAKRLAALRKLLPTLKGPHRKKVAAQIRALEAEVPPARDPKRTSTKSGPTSVRTKKPRGGTKRTETKIARSPGKASRGSDKQKPIRGKGPKRIPVREVPSHTENLQRRTRHDAADDTHAYAPVPRGILPDPIDSPDETDWIRLGAARPPDDDLPNRGCGLDLTPDEDEPVVSLGFSQLTQAELPIPPTRTLAVGQAYYLWLQIGAPVLGAVNEQPSPLPLDLLPKEVEIDVVILATGVASGTGGFVVPKDCGRIRIANRQSQVTRALAKPAVDSALLQQRLFFPVTAPTQPGEHHLACHLYYQGALVQSYDIVAQVTAQSQDRATRAVTARMDYVLSEKLTPSSLAGYGTHALSIAVGINDDSSHRFAFNSAAGNFVRDASFDGQEVQDLIDRARRALRAVSWGSDTTWTPDKAYRYEKDIQIGQMTTDLARLAIAGYRNYDAMVQRLGGDADALAERMRTPGVIQLALKQSVRLVLPLALVYDHQLDADGDLSSYSLCKQFSESMAALESHPCFLGNCPQRKARNRVVCPSGFWGFRHEIGIPPTLRASDGTPAQLPALLACPDKPRVDVAVSMDSKLVERDTHLLQLGGLLEPSQLRIARTRTDALGFLRSGGAHLVYFYCHGGVDDRTPYLQIGEPKERISRATLLTERINWIDPRALVFINGCHTTDLEPERAIDLVSGFLQTAHGSGVIGTEITVFEPLATKFATLCIAALLERQTVGAAIRQARLALLRDWNPLGLIYVPFALATLRLAPATA